MIQIEPTTDVAYLDKVMHNPRISAAMTDDSCPDPTKFSIAPVLENTHSLFLKVLVNGAPAGWFWLMEDKVAPFTLEAHTALLPNCRGSAALQAGQKTLDWVFGHTPCQRINTLVWTDDRRSAWFAYRMGFSKVDQVPWPSTRQGKPVDAVHFTFIRQQWVNQRN